MFIHVKNMHTPRSLSQHLADLLLLQRLQPGCVEAEAKKGVEGQSTQRNRETVLWSSWDMQKRLRNKKSYPSTVAWRWRVFLTLRLQASVWAPKWVLGFRRSFGQRWLCGGRVMRTRVNKKRNSNIPPKNSKLYKVKTQVSHIDLAGAPNGWVFGQK